LILSPAPTKTLGKYYARIRDEFNERRYIGDYAKIHMNHNEGAISHRWSVIKTVCNKFLGNIETMRNRNQSGKSAMDIVSFFALCTFPIHVYIPMMLIAQLMCALLVASYDVCL
jgi:hypothetical protein